MSGVLIIGAGQAAAQLCISLRQGGYTDPIRVVGDEPYLPYQRPPLSKEFLKERPAADTLYFRQQKFWDDNHITIDLGIAAKAVDPANKRVTLADGRELSYSALVLATGTRARALPLPGIDRPGVFSPLRPFAPLHSTMPEWNPSRGSAGRWRCQSPRHSPPSE